MVHPHKLSKEGSVLVVVDVQDKLLHAVDNWQMLLANTIKMVKFVQALEIPIIITEQYPKGLGPTNASVKELFSEPDVLEKTTFSCFGSSQFEAKLAELGAKTLVLVGIEAHICVCQTALDALARGYGVHIVVDAVSSRTLENKEIGLAKLRQAGGVVTSSEIALYEWLERSDSKEFKAILPLVK